MSNEYKKTLARFEAAVREYAFMGSFSEDRNRVAAAVTEYEASKRALVRKLQYRALRIDLAIAVEFGYRQCEKGVNLQAALQAAQKEAWLLTSI